MKKRAKNWKTTIQTSNIYSNQEGCVRKIVCLSVFVIILAGCAATTQMTPAVPQASESIQRCFEIPARSLSLKDITILFPWMYAVSILIYQLFIRSILTVLKTGSVRNDKEGRLATFLDLFFNRRPSRNGAEGAAREENDHFLPVCLGIIEMVFFPVFIAIGKWEFIAAWIGIKTAAQWTQWSKSRPSYMRFLIGSSLVVLASIFLSSFVQVNKDHMHSSEICYEQMSLNNR